MPSIETSRLSRLNYNFENKNLRKLLCGTTSARSFPLRYLLEMSWLIKCTSKADIFTSVHSAYSFVGSIPSFDCTNFEKIDRNLLLHFV